MICQDLIQLLYGQIFFGLEIWYEGRAQREPCCFIKLTGSLMAMFKSATKVLSFIFLYSFLILHSMEWYWPCAETPVVPLPDVLQKQTVLPSPLFVFVFMLICLLRSKRTEAPSSAARPAADFWTWCWNCDFTKSFLVITQTWCEYECVDQPQASC